VIALIIYCGLSVRNFIRIRLDLTVLLYDISEVTFFLTQCIIDDNNALAISSGKTYIGLPVMYR